ncbi:MAG: heme peroxidase family protein [Lysobacterales bacterium]
MTKAKGCAHARLGNFGKLFPKLTPLKLNEAQAAALGGKNSPMHDVGNVSPNASLPAGYTFFAQFIDHDITLDTTSDLHGKPLSNGAISHLPNLRTPTLDMDCVYGFGPEASPHLYAGATAPGRLLVGNSGNPDDLPRNESGTALIGDPRNDENIFVSQMQLLFIRFHNRVYDSLVSSVSLDERFEKAQEIVRHHYQYLVVHDFLHRICDPKIFEFALKKVTGHQYPLVYEADKHGNLPMPVEFSVAAYRFGHTTVRTSYAANGQFPDVELFDERFGTQGFSALPPELTVDWRFLLPVNKCIAPLTTKRFDLQFPEELICMPDPIVGRGASDNERSLAFRNLLRGNALALPCGQAVAAALKAAGYPISTNFAPLKLTEVIPAEKETKDLADETPLFFYLMREAGTLGKGERLGPTGSAILLEVLLGGLLHCEDSILKDPKWKPNRCIAGPHKGFELADVVRYVES